MIKMVRLTSDPKGVNYAGKHTLAKAGKFSSDLDQTVYAVDWKGHDQGLKDREYYYSYEEMNVPFVIKSTGKESAFEDKHYYWNKVRTDTDYLNWLCETSKTSSEGVPYYKIFTQGGRVNGIYTHNLGYKNVEARGIILLSADKSQVSFFVEYTSEDKDENKKTVRNVELVYKRK